MGCFDFLLGLTGHDTEPTIYVTQRNGRTYVGETGRGVARRYDKGDEEMLNMKHTFTSTMNRQQRIAVEEAVIAEYNRMGIVTDNYNRHSKQRRRHASRS